MDSIIEVVGRENGESREVVLYPEGIFYRAYGYSALRFIRHLRAYQVKKRYYKKLGGEVCYLGFPQSALEGVLAEGCKAERRPDGTVVVSGPFEALDEQEYEAWVRSVPLSVVRPRAPAGGGAEAPEGRSAGSVSAAAQQDAPEGANAEVADRRSAAEGEVLRRLHAFALESATPIECMLLLSELKKTLNG